MNALVILAGGKSSRMGMDKTFLPYQETTFLGYLLQKAQDSFDRILISAGSEEHGLRIYEYLKKEGSLCSHVQPEIILDIYKSIGPMGGLLSVFEQTDLEHFACVAVDLPEADMNVLLALLERCRQANAPAVMFSFCEEHIETCAAAYSRAAYELLKQAQEKNAHGLIRALDPENVDLLHTGDLKRLSPSFTELSLKHSFRNINTAEEYQHLQKNGSGHDSL